MSLLYEQTMQVIEKHPELADSFQHIQREILQHKILAALHEGDMLNEIVFKGGTCLRLCFHGDRFSEDLDFYGGDADFGKLVNIPQIITEGLERLDVPTQVKAPKHWNDAAPQVNRLWVRCVTRPATSRGRENIDRVKIEIDNNPRPHTTHQTVTHAFMDVNTIDRPFVIETPVLPDICADKCIAFPISVHTRPDNPRYRDIWDIQFILSRIREDDVLPILARKLNASPKVNASYSHALRTTIDGLEEIIESEPFDATMRRFVLTDRVDATINDPRYRIALTNRMTYLFVRLLKAHEQNDLNQSRVR